MSMILLTLYLVSSSLSYQKKFLMGYSSLKNTIFTHDKEIPFNSGLRLEYIGQLHLHNTVHASKAKKVKEIK